MAELVLSSAQVNRAALTPMMQHYIEMKQQYPHAVMLYRLGDFFEAFFEVIIYSTVAILQIFSSFEQFYNLRLK